MKITLDTIQSSWNPRSENKQFHNIFHKMFGHTRKFHRASLW
ncbi:hypothetical protein HanIR_Chr09g0431861 [Helianthus annuus]|nr:hypothetical protein HanIR_Chr09g0431861 [Helianthus annuus]